MSKMSQRVGAGARVRSFWVGATLALAGLMALTGTPPLQAQTSATTACACEIPSGPPNPHPHLVGYLPLYKGLDWVAFVRKLDFTGMTELNLAFLNPPLCPARCTAHDDMTLTAPKLTDAGLNAIIAAAHLHGTRVLASLGGASKDKNIMAFYNAGLAKPFAAAITKFVNKYNLDGVDVDVEQPSQMGVPYSDSVDALIADLHPEGKLVTAAVAEYIQPAMQNATLQKFDLVNVMIYADYARAVHDMNFYATRQHVPRQKLTLGIGFFADSRTQGRRYEANYNDLLAAYPNAWAVDTVGGGSFDGGAVFHYAGEATTKKEAELSLQYGGVMIWELSGDNAYAPHSLLQVIQKTLHP